GARGIPRGHRAADDGKCPSRVRRATRRHALAGRGCVTTTANVPTDIAIAQAAKLRPVAEIAAELGLGDDEVELYGRYKAKIRLQALARRPPQGRLVLVTGINPTPAGNALGLHTRRITWPRTIDMNDRALRNIIVGLGGLNGGPTREERFVIIPGSEIMAIMALASGIEDLERRLARIIVGLTPGKT